MGAPSGYATHIREIINGFRLLGHEVLPVIMGGDTWNPEANNNSSSVLKPVVKKLTPLIIWQTVKDVNLLRFDNYAKKILEEKVQKFKPDIIYERGFYLMKSGSEIAKKYQIPHYLELNAPYEEEKIQLEGPSLLISKSHKITKHNLENAHKVIVVSSALKNYFSEKYHIDSKKIIITPNAINPDKIKQLNPDKINSLKEKHNISDKDFIIGFVGSIFPYHGVDILLDAFTNISSVSDNLKLLIVGDGEVLPLLKKKAENLNLTSKVIFTGNVPPEEVYNYIELMDICVMAKSNWYGSPVKIFEYGALGKAVIAPNTIPVKDVLINEINAIIVEPESDKIANALKKFFYDSNFRFQLGFNLKKTVLEKHTWLKMAEKILSE
jgi:glycosyltransferase involved in cell wall biosynthesis